MYDGIGNGVSERRTSHCSDVPGTHPRWHYSRWWPDFAACHAFTDNWGEKEEWRRKVFKGRKENTHILFMQCAVLLWKLLERLAWCKMNKRHVVFCTVNTVLCVDYTVVTDKDYFKNRLCIALKGPYYAFGGFSFPVVCYRCLCMSMVPKFQYHPKMSINQRHP